ncbi:hypothetical protein [Acinetobacter sp. ANC 3832]|nr:hypothetical protein [Acinetobacter sp. ANC 3832]
MNSEPSSLESQALTVSVLWQVDGFVQEIQQGLQKSVRAVN